ncbi:MAG: hypothetical protein M1813_003911 [Trichoglossum hirsutum]|nr:MAG: hypothetical protein M1813_003911 [Trichoglossum hirsutum]
MGSSASKPTAGQTSEHVFAAKLSSGTPVRFSQELIGSLQSSPETDSTREKTLELHIQSRVASELERLRERESRLLKELEEQISSELPPSPSDDTQTEQSTPTSNTVHESITSLRSKFDSRPKLGIVDEAMEKAKGEVVRCLRENDRRPLDCWKEVEAFRKEVGRLEKGFVERVIG